MNCDDAGENDAFERLCTQEGIDITFECATPGNNDKMIYNRVHAALTCGSFSLFKKWAIH